MKRLLLRRYYQVVWWVEYNLLMTILKFQLSHWFTVFMITIDKAISTWRIATTSTSTWCDTHVKIGTRSSLIFCVAIWCGSQTSTRRFSLLVEMESGTTFWYSSKTCENSRTEIKDGRGTKTQPRNPVPDPRGIQMKQESYSSISKSSSESSKMIPDERSVKQGEHSMTMGLRQGKDKISSSHDKKENKEAKDCYRSFRGEIWVLSIPKVEILRSLCAIQMCRRW